MLYKCQIRSLMEFSPLTWGGAAPTHRELLDRMQRRAERLLHGEAGNSSLQPLQHRRDVARLCVMYKVHIMDAEHLRPLRQAPRPVPRLTRAATADSTHHALKEPRCNTLHHQLQFVPTYTRMWNEFVTTHPDAKKALGNMSLFKKAVNTWLEDRHLQ